MARTGIRTTTAPRTVARIALAAALVFAGLSHLFWAREEFQNQVPSWMPMDADGVVVASGVAEIGLGGALIALPRERRRIGWIVAAFFVAVFPGNIAQFTEKRSGFGLRTDRARGIRLLFQPALVAVALWSTAAPRR